MSKIIGLSHKGAKYLTNTIAWIVFLILSISYLSYANAGILFQSEVSNNKFLYKGDIELGDAGYLVTIPDNSILYLESPGGRFLEGLSMGYVIKQKNLTVRPYGKGCYSSCAFAAAMSNNVKGKFHFHAPFNVLDKSIDPDAIKIMKTYMKRTGKFTNKDINIIAKTPHTTYHTIKL